MSADTTLAPSPPEVPGIPDAADPIALFREWMEEAEASEPNDANAVCVATSTPDGMPSARMVLLKGLDDRGFAFYFGAKSVRHGQSRNRTPLCPH